MKNADMVFVTGGTGFLGAHLICGLLANGEEVRALCRPGSDTSGFRSIQRFWGGDHAVPLPEPEWITGDICDPFMLKEAIPAHAEVYHCAAMVGFGPEDKTGLGPVNAGGTANMVNACLENEVRKLCYVSSIGTMGTESGHREITEVDKWQDGARHSDYSRSKYRAELEVWRGMAEGLNAVIVCPSVITGPGSAVSSFGKMITMVQNKMDYFPPGSNAWVDVRDVAEAMMQLMKSDAEGRYIVSAGNITYQTILGWIAESLNMRAPSIKASRSLMRLAGLYLDLRQRITGKDNPLTPDLIRISCNHSNYSSAKYLHEFDVTFRSVRDSVADACIFITGDTV